ncbi:MAG: ribbon-helix-helix domain-containing protein [Rhodospirillaceae bacterium]|nr:ribbon-helix-helix domain-containing protein [Rhodospirillaceae bacterium]
MTAGTIRKRSVTLAGHRTSVSVEDAFWDALKAIAEREGRSVTDLLVEIDTHRAGNLSSGVRLYVLAWLQRRSGVAPISPASP